ncbi:MAG: hypothetical protein A2632_01895 [Candidatus Pacebacteria bacterium RIFCSPHIGHO2_01_FULL_46_16]|nr:MAG: hypothetical protein A2632_01895 [Candidatus Pacebacteria bacterium RIFCSPHIGHO2_01_FULL_46_16]OGJ22000.1 MAG: hypothetical protein A3J60_02835 [Candidatus Pacebacteria bacterium RIFCSPHIGHO2_02_FULL_46_9]OGJ37980.1 MAG: hypothetical protein A3A82_00765 [Candidatus Pacebacteria bacterium RIFCSPLOWO2_01_FULL_47_12]
MPPIPFTPPAYAQLQTDRARLQKERKEVMIRLQTAREMGDLSENGAYRYAKFELGSIGRQLRRINHLLEHGMVVQQAKHSQVQFGSSVTLTGPKGTQTVLIVSEHESDPTQHKLAMTSPIGAAIMGKVAGDCVNVVTPRGAVQYTIVTIA